MLFLVFMLTLTGASIFTWLKHKFVQAELRYKKMEMRLKRLEYEEED